MSLTRATVQNIAVKGFILNEEGRVLVLRQADYSGGTKPGRYGFPGGKLELGEPVADGLRREILEETGLSVKVGQPFFVGEWSPKVRGTVRQIVGVFFTCTAMAGDVQLNREHDEYLWVDPENYGELDWMEPEGEVIPAWLERFRV